jgi:hypothetical protein
MSRAAVCLATAEALASVPAAFAPRVMIGFDGFIDHIIDVVGTREHATAYTPIPTIDGLAKRIGGAAGQSTNLELVVKTSKIGGNGPIMANAMCALGYGITAIGLLGEGGIDPVFAPLAARAAQCISLGPPATTDALEFRDGKVMLGKLEPLARITYDRLIEVVGLERLGRLFAEADGVATVNWTMSLGMTALWQRLAAELLPRVLRRRPLWFIDLADPAKRTVIDLLAAFSAIRVLQQHVDVVLGLNGTECRQVLESLGQPYPQHEIEWEAARLACERIQEQLGISWVMCHLVRSAAVAWGGAGAAGGPGPVMAGSVGLEGFFEPRPLITTGAGDHFNAGFMAALLAGLAPAHAIMAGGATSGYYVRTGVSPDRQQIQAFLRAFA